jgi:phospholipid/cholesterol/gamma-HCH transport system substrate-binding protein
MAKEKGNIVKLGIFVMAGLLFLITLLYLIGKNKNMFGSNYTLRTRFGNVGGLKSGNNVRYAGIEIGTVKKLEILNDSAIEVTMTISRNMNTVIRKNAVTSLGTDGLIGNRVINIIPGQGDADLAADGDMLLARSIPGMEDMLETLSASNTNIRQITEGLIAALGKINNSTGLWRTLSDTGMGISLKRTARNLELASSNAEQMTQEIREVIVGVRQGKGTAGALLTDTALALRLKSTLADLENTARQANKLASDLDSVMINIDHEIQSGQGTVHVLLKDTAAAGNISRSLSNIEKGTASFNENMEAMKHNWLFKGYFKKQEKEKAKQEQKKPE